MDRDHNGMVFEDEFLDFMELRDTLADDRIGLSIAASSTDPINQFDTNNDGRLTHAEFARALATIKSWDANQDERITGDEIPAASYGTFHLGRTAPGLRRPRMSRQMQPAAMAKDAPVWFQKMDRNRDGEVSFREFLGPLDVFRKLDANHDGVIDAHEAQQIIKMMASAPRDDH